MRRRALLTWFSEPSQNNRTARFFFLGRLKSIRANGVHGELSVQDALQTALRDTGLEAEILGSGAIAVSFVSSPDNSRGREQMKTSFGGKIFAFMSALMASGGSVVAQEAPAASTDSLDAVVVTGTLIKGNRENSQLVTNIDSEEIRRRGASDATDILSAVTQNELATTPNDGVRTGGLTSLANLRSLGPENTLVLVNGRRMGNNPIFDNGVDLNTIPTALIDSVDVLADGASSIYGSDAVAGVINFKLKQDLQGLVYDAQAFDPEAKGGALYATSLAGGVGALHDDGWNFTFGVSWRERTSITSKDRDFSDTSYLPSHGLDNRLGQPYPANYLQGNIYANPYAPACALPGLSPAGSKCLFDADAAGVIDLQNPERQTSEYGKATTLLAGNQELSLEYFHSESSESNALTGTTIFGGYNMPPTNPYFPGNGIVPGVPGLDPTQPVSIFSRYTPAGRRITQNLTDTDRLLADLTGSVSGFEYDLWAMRSASTAALNSLGGALLISGIDNGLAGTNGAPFLNPFGPPTPAQAAYLQSITVNTDLAVGHGSLSMIGASLNRSLFDLPGGPAKGALAFEFGRETFEYGINPINSLLEGAVAGTADPAAGDRKRHSLTGELLLPVTNAFNVNASLRADDYSDFGSTVNPKLLLSYEITPDLDLHASANKGFRAPPLPKLLAPQSLGLVSGLYNDPVLCPGGVPNAAAGGIQARDCGQAFNSLTGGNPNLQPQRSKAFSAGATMRLGDGAWVPGRTTGSLDFWHYELTNTIGSLAPDTIFDNPIQFNGYIVRCNNAVPAFKAISEGCRFGGGGDPIAYVELDNSNLGTTKTQGLDLGINWSLETATGTWGTSYRGTYTTTFQYQNAPGDPFSSRKGAYRDGAPLIPYSHFVELTWDRGAYSAALQNRLKSGYEDCNAECGIAPQYWDHVGVYSLWNVVGSYRFNDALTLSLHINNLFDTDPPFTNGEESNCTGCDLRYIDPTGRSFGISINGKFGAGSKK